MKSQTILVAEDDPALLESIRIRLASEGYDVLCATDGYQAVALASQRRPDLLVLDIHMPAGDGFSVQDRVQRMPQLGRVPVVYLTGDRSLQLLERAKGLGVRSLLRKPFETAELLRVVRRTLAPEEPQALVRQPIDIHDPEVSAP